MGDEVDDPAADKANTSSLIEQLKEIKAEVTAAKRQAEYEGEVEVFHALERLEHPLFIMHSFKYTHQQYALFVDHQCKRKDTEVEGEADFVALQDDLIAIYEVKAVESTKENAKKVFERNYNKSREQLEKTCNLIINICSKTGSFEPKVCKYTVFTNIDRKSAEKISKYSSLSDSEKREIIFKDDLDRIGNCFERETDFITRDNWNYVMNPSYIKAESLWILLGIWCADEKNKFSMDKWDLGRAINGVDRFIKDASISDKPQGPKCSKIKGAPAELKELGILCLTEEQKQVFHSKNQRIVINGPAGSGKTLLILGKIIKLARKSGGLIIVIVASRWIADWYETKLEKVGISSVRKLTSDTTIDGYKVFIYDTEDYKFNKGGFVSTWAKGRICMLFNMFDLDAHTFIDDFHVFDFAFKYYPYGITVAQKYGCDSFWELTLQQLGKKSEKTCWICYDTLQSTSYSCFDQQTGNIEKWESKYTVYKLSKNLRSSYEIADFLSFLRNERLNNIRDCITLCTEVANSKDRFKPFDVEQDIGHYLHGPTPRIEWLDLHGRGEQKSEHLKNVLINEVVNILTCKKVAIIHDDYGDPVRFFKETCVTEEPSVDIKQRIEKIAAIDHIRLNEICQEAKETIHSEFTDCKMDLQVFHMDEVVSAEWPAVIGIIKVREKCNIAFDLEHDEITRDYYKFIDEPLKYEVEAKQDPIDRVLAKMNAIVSRARSYSVIICVIDEEESFHGTETEACAYNDKYIDAAMLKCYGNSAINKALYGKLSKTRSKMTACDEIDLNREQLKILLNNISLIDVPIRLPNGKMVNPKDLAESVASTSGCKVNNDKNKKKMNMNLTDAELAIYFRNRRKLILKPFLKHLMQGSHIFGVSKGTFCNSTTPQLEWQNFINEMEMRGVVNIGDRLSAEERRDIMKQLFYVSKEICGREFRTIFEDIEESVIHGRTRTERWKKYQSASPTEKYEVWVAAFTIERYSKAIKTLDENSHHGQEATVLTNLFENSDLIYEEYW
ncbi:hypothetical protein ACHWQZ_G019390 [Mnemiopsis leidyi]